MGDDDRNTILRRRRFFIATAVAGLAATQCDKPKVCLNISEVTDGSTVAPTVCLSPPPIPPDASTPEVASPEAGADTSAPPTDAGSDAKRPTTGTPPLSTGPRVCLTPLRKPSSER